MVFAWYDRDKIRRGVGSSSYAPGEKSEVDSLTDHLVMGETGVAVGLFGDQDRIYSSTSSALSEGKLLFLFQSVP